jgi:hypothetical protein
MGYLTWRLHRLPEYKTPFHAVVQLRINPANPDIFIVEDLIVHCLRLYEPSACSGHQISLQLTCH